MSRKACLLKHVYESSNHAACYIITYDFLLIQVCDALLWLTHSLPTRQTEVRSPANPQWIGGVLTGEYGVGATYSSTLPLDATKPNYELDNLRHDDSMTGKG